MMTFNNMLRGAGILAIALTIGCTSGKEEKQQSATEDAQPQITTTARDTTNKPGDTTVKKENAEPVPKERSGEGLTYSAYRLKGVDSAVKVFRKKYTTEQQWIILALNRLDANNLWRPDSIIIPDTIAADLNYYSPFPKEVQILKDVKKFVIFSYPIQAFAAYENGTLVYWGPTSMGSKIHPTPTGLHFTNWKSKKAISTVDDEWILKWNFNIANKEGVGWHQYTLPGYPASHSCLRMLDEQAAWMYTWAQQWILKDNNTILAKGTPVVVFGAYPFGSRRPWRNMLEDPKANDISEQDMEKEIQPFIQEILQAQQTRDSVEAARATANDSVAKK